MAESTAPAPVVDTAAAAATDTVSMDENDSIGVVAIHIVERFALEMLEALKADPTIEDDKAKFAALMLRLEQKYVPELASEIMEEVADQGCKCIAGLFSKKAAKKKSAKKVKASKKDK